MRKQFFLLAAAMLLCAGCNNTQNNDPWGKIDPEKNQTSSSTYDGSIQSKAMNRSMTYSVWLPAGYDEAKTYPFLYLLHGYETGDQNGKFNRCWLDKGNAAYIADSYQKSNGSVEMVIIMPNGLDKFYFNEGYEQFFEEELMPELEKKYHCNGRRAIAGLSMGGFGTLYHALKYPEKFTYAYAMSPAAKVDWSWLGIKVDPKDFIALQEDKSVFPPFTIEVGLQDMTVNNNDSKILYRSMTQNGITCEFIERDGTHDWPFWQACLPKALRKAGASFK